MEIARILKDEGYIANFKVTEDDKQGVLRVYLKYGPGMERVITDLQRVSRPGCRIYCGKDQIPRVYGGLGHQHPVHLARPHDRPQRRPRRRGRRDPLQRLVRSRHVSRRTQGHRRPQGREGPGRRERLEVQGPKGKLQTPVPPGITVRARRAASSACKRKNDERQQRAFHGLARALAQNAIKGVTEGFSKELDIVGVGYKAAVEGRRSCSRSGYSHPVEFKIPEGIKIAVDKQTHIVVSGIDRQKVGQVAAEIRGLRKPDPVQAEGDPLRGRGPEEEGRQGRRHREPSKEAGNACGRRRPGNAREGRR